MINMNNQNILKYYSDKFDLKLNNSEYYDLQLSNAINLDHNPSQLNVDDFDIKINQPLTGTSCDKVFTNLFTNPTPPNILLKQRVELGWVVDIIFNRNGNDWNNGKSFYYWGAIDETDDYLYGDNNLTFSFTDNGEILWSSIRFSGGCVTESGYTEGFYMSSGLTKPICLAGEGDFKVTIAFERNVFLTGCDLLNLGGINDLISGGTVTNGRDVIENQIESEYETILHLNKKWYDSEYFRRGTLKIYGNGILIGKFKNWVEIIPTVRGTNPIGQIWGKGGLSITDLGCTEFDMKRIQYFEKPMNFIQIRTFLKQDSQAFTFSKCNIYI